MREKDLEFWKLRVETRFICKIFLQLEIVVCLFISNRENFQYNNSISLHCMAILNLRERASEREENVCELKNIPIIYLIYVLFCNASFTN